MTEQLDLSRFRSPLADRMGIEIIEAGPERTVGTMPVEGNTQPNGVLHGGASCVLAETLGSIAAAMHGWPERVALGVDLNATHHRGISAGTVTGVATPLHLGKSVASYEVTITDADGQRVCTARLTCFLRPTPTTPPR
jgi:1,4-dihydroxy-2-naphthoyl-CoA hydrolase